MPIDPRLNCAAEICCDQDGARLARVAILQDLGAGDLADLLADAMKAKGLVFMPAEMAAIISEVADHPGRKSAKADHPPRLLR